MTFKIGKNPCNKCGSSDAFHFYGEGLGGYCWSCQYTILSDDEKLARDEGKTDREEKVSTRTKITEAENERIKGVTSPDGREYRGIRKETNIFFGIRYEFDEASGELVAQYVPTTINGDLVGYRRRKMPKDFSSPIGQVGKECDMIFQFRFKNHSKTCIISGGETKALNTYQMMKDNQIARGYGDYETTAVVCSTLGESGAFKQIQAQYEFFDQFEKIVICMDSDEAGENATEQIIKVLPKGKAWVMNMRYKDADIYVEKGLQKEFIQDFLKAKKYVPSGITASTDIKEKMREFLSTPRITLPPYMHKLQKKLRGGLPQSCILNLLSASGTGKSTHVDAMTLHWIMKSDLMVGIVPMETDAGEYGVNLLSSYAEFKINLLETVEQRLEYLDSEDSNKLQDELFYKEDGSPRFYILDAEADTLQSRVEYLIVSLGCKIVIIDPIQDVFDMLGEDAQAKFMAWMKRWMKTGVLFVNVNHARKNGGGHKANSKGAELSEEDMMGSSTIFKSGGINLILMRNKDAEDDIEKNTTIMKLSKARGVGETGLVGKYFYELEKHKLWDLDDYLNTNHTVF